MRFLAHGPGYSLFLTAKEAVLILQKPVTEADSDKAQAAVLRMTLKGANLKASITGQAHLPGKVNYLRGKDPEQWHTNIPTYAQVKYDQIYPGIDLIYYGRQHQLEYDFIIESGADPKAIHLAFAGAKEMRLDEGQLVLTTATGEVRLRKPILYQEIGGEKHPVSGGYVRQGPHQVGFRVRDLQYTACSLVIDPVLSYSTYLGGSGDDFGTAIAVDARGQAYVIGTAYSADFPIYNALQPTLNGYSDAFVAKLSFQEPHSCHPDDNEDDED